MGRETVRRTGLRLRCHRAGETGKSRRAIDRQTGDGGTGRRWRIPLPGRVFVRTGLESVGHQTLVRRIVERFGERGGGGPGSVRARFGNQWVHPFAVRLLWSHWPSPLLWTGEPARSDASGVDVGQDQTALPVRRRLRVGDGRYCPRGEEIA